MKYLFWVEYEDGDFTAENLGLATAKRLMEWHQKHDWSVVKACGWCQDDGSVSTQIIKNRALKAKKAKAND